MIQKDLIDAVYLWCDGKDPSFVRRKRDLLESLGLTWNESNFGDIRFIDNQELKFSLRSINRYIPWINHIFIVTDKQKPSWLIDHPKITLIDHKQIIPEEFLPTFNSVAIESFIDRIPGLAEKFLLFNDDMFINAPLDPSFFFKNDLPKVRLIKDKTRWQFKTLEQGKKALNTTDISSFRKTLINAWYLFSKTNGISPFYTLAHTVDAYTKSSMQFVQNKYPDLIKRNATHFRTDDNVQRVIYQLEMVKSMNCPFVEINNLTFLQKHFPLLTKRKIDSFEGTESPKTWKRIRTLKPKMFCLNASNGDDADVKQKSLKLLNELFPFPSPYEKS